MQVCKVVRMMIAVNVLLHHTALCNTRPDYGARRNECQVVVAFEFLQQLPHCGTLNIKTTNGVSIPYAVRDLFVLLKLFDLRNVYLFIPVFAYYFYRFPDMTEAPLTKNIQFIQADLFGHVHVYL